VRAPLAANGARVFVEARFLWKYALVCSHTRTLCALYYVNLQDVYACSNTCRRFRISQTGTWYRTSLVLVFSSCTYVTRKPSSSPRSWVGSLCRGTNTPSSAHCHGGGVLLLTVQRTSTEPVGPEANEGHECVLILRWSSRHTLVLRYEGHLSQINLHEPYNLVVFENTHVSKSGLAADDTWSHYRKVKRSLLSLGHKSR
jgi:hypothetical protein